MKTKIEHITEEQKAKMPQYVQKWIDIGRDTTRLDEAKTKKAIDNYRKMINKKVDVPLIILDNPLESWVACSLLLEHKVSLDNLHEELKSVFDGNPKKYKIPTARLPWQSGSFFVSTFSFYDFMIEELGVELEQDLYAKYKIWEATSQLGCIYPLDDFTIVSQKPTEIHMNENNVLHKDGGPALVYAGMGDIKIYSLNGVTVPEYIATTPEEKLDLEYYNTITNADVKAEFVRKVGIERFKSKGKLLDSYVNYDEKKYPWVHRSKYELYDMECLFDGLTTAPYLSMENITSGIYHFEGVSPQCQTLPAAIKERTGFNMNQIKAIA